MKMLSLFWLLMIFVSCSNSTSKSNLVAKNNANSFFNVYVLDTLKSLINRDINEVKKLHYSQDVSLRDTIFESEDESNWKGIVFYRGNQILLFVETSWEDLNIIKRITVLSSAVDGLNDLKIGAKFKDIKPNLSQAIPSYPDGYFGLKDKNDKQITYFFDIGNNSDLSIGNVKFETIPDNIIVNQILIE
jgi:hypothetical protein